MSTYQTLDQLHKVADDEFDNAFELENIALRAAFTYHSLLEQSYQWIYVPSTLLTEIAAAATAMEETRKEADKAYAKAHMASNLVNYYGETII